MASTPWALFVDGLLELPNVVELVRAQGEESTHRPSQALLRGVGSRADLRRTLEVLPKQDATTRALALAHLATALGAAARGALSPTLETAAIDLLRHGTDAVERRLAVAVLAEQTGGVVVDALFFALGVAGEYHGGVYRSRVRAAAVAALSRLRSPDTGARALAMLTPESTAVAAKSARSTFSVDALEDQVDLVNALLRILAAVRYPPALPAVLKLARAKNERISDQARVALLHVVDDGRFVSLFGSTRAALFRAHAMPITGEIGGVAAREIFDRARGAIDAAFPRRGAASPAHAATPVPPPRAPKKPARPAKAKTAAELETALAATSAAARAAVVPTLIAALERDRGRSKRFGDAWPSKRSTTARFETLDVALPPSLVAWLAFDTRWLAHHTALPVGGSRRLVAASLAGALIKNAHRAWPGYYDSLVALLPGPALLLEFGSDSARLLYLGAPNLDGEGAILNVDWDDVPFVELVAPGLDAWLVDELGAPAPREAKRRWEKADAVLRERWFSGGPQLDWSPTGWHRPRE